MKHLLATSQGCDGDDSSWNVKVVEHSWNTVETWTTENTRQPDKGNDGALQSLPRAGLGGKRNMGQSGVHTKDTDYLGRLGEPWMLNQLSQLTVHHTLRTKT